MLELIKSLEPINEYTLTGEFGKKTPDDVKKDVATAIVHGRKLNDLVMLGKSFVVKCKR